MKTSSLKRKITKVMNGLMALSAIYCVSILPIMASSHSEAPLISMDRYADNTDTYAFRSVEAGRSGFVTLIANYIPFQEPSGGPQYYRWDDTVLYEIRVDNTGDGNPDVTYQFRFTTQTVNANTILGHTAVNQDGAVTSLTDPDYNQFQTYTVTRVNNNTNTSAVVASGLRTPPSNVGPRVTPNYEANLGMPAVNPLPNGGRVFAGQRDEYFYIDVGGVFDALNLRSVGMCGGVDTTQGFNVSTIAIEVPIQDLTNGGTVPTGVTASNAVVGVWATASRQTTRVINPDGTRNNTGNFVQISRLGNPLVNEVVIPLALKDAFNSLAPVNDNIAGPAVLDPELARLLNAVFGISVPPAPRNDLAHIFAIGIPVNGVTGPNYNTFLSDGNLHEYLRLNVAMPITPIANINRLGLLGGDTAGFPNGRRPHDDVTDIALRAVAGGTPFTPAFNVAPNNTLGDGVSSNPEGPLLTRFPYLLPPNQGNQPRSANSRPCPAALRGDTSKAPVVNSDGNFAK